MFVRENKPAYFHGRISSSPFTDEFPLPAVLIFAPRRLCAMHQSPRVFNGAAGIRKALPEKQTIPIPTPTPTLVPGLVLQFMDLYIINTTTKRIS
jgi:hypothetical protein